MMTDQPTEREDGINSGARNVGRLALSLVLLALGLGASVWFGVYMGVHQFRRELSQEERAAIVVGAEVRPTEKIAVALSQSGCVRVTRADLDGRNLIIYTSNGCHRELTYVEWHWEELSPSGTVVHGGWTNWQCPAPRLPGDSAECRFDNIELDDRAASMRVWVKP